MKLRNYINWLVLTIVLLLTIAACAGRFNRIERQIVPVAAANRTDCRQIQHVGGTTQICGRPQRIAVLGPYLLEPLLALDVQPIAFADYAAWHRGKYSNPRQQIPYLGDRITGSIANLGMVGTPSVEALLKVKPDLILGIDIANAQHYPTLSKIAPTLILKWGDSDRNLQTIAQAVDRADRATALLSEMKQQIATARQEFAPLVAARPKLLLLISAELREIGLVTKYYDRCSSLPQALGFELVYPPQLDRSQLETSAPISIETFADLDRADAIVLLGHNFRDSPQNQIADGFATSVLNKLKQAWAKNPSAKLLKASKTGRVYFMPSYLCLGLPGPIGTNLYLNEFKQQLLPRKMGLKSLPSQSP